MSIKRRKRTDLESRSMHAMQLAIAALLLALVSTLFGIRAFYREREMQVHIMELEDRLTESPPKQVAPVLQQF